MARLFTVDFTFKNQTYSALVTVKDQNRDLACMVHYLDASLQNILQTSSLVFNFSEGLQKPKKLPNKLSEELLQCTCQAISNHLKK